ncbi:MAG: phosphoserine phosphatase SerB [Hyphomicrobium sp.]
MINLTLVITAKPDAHAVDPRRIGEFWSAVPQEWRVVKQWLSDRDACSISLSFDDESAAENIRHFAFDEFSSLPLDINFIPEPHSSKHKRLLVADMESTIIEQELIDELADYVGKRAEIASITERAMRGELDFEAAIKERVAMLAGLDQHVLDEVYERRVTLMPGAETLIRTMKANGAYTALVSGGFTVFTEKVARRLGFDEHQANGLDIENGRLTGRVKEPILGRQAKRAALLRLIEKLGIDPADTIAVGDGANDLDMLAAAGLGVAFRAKPKVQEAAHALPNGAVVNHGDLTALLYLQGYHRSEFAA